MRNASSTICALGRLPVLGEDAKATRGFVPYPCEVLPDGVDPIVVQAVDTAGAFGFVDRQTGLLEQNADAVTPRVG
jgi:hypothetical protein